MFCTSDMNPIAIRHHLEEQERCAEAFIDRNPSWRSPPVTLIAPALVLATVAALV